MRHFVPLQLESK